ncbi:unnamed protein product [Didymodactylos carnosus]|nr:unnamed protein product [Didymodactylos carnosus]CAF3767308.1 unnamed protein product [Didymodactylos carnosus]
MNTFHEYNASISRIVQVDYDLSGRTASGREWTIRFSINADYANEARGYQPHYGGEVKWTGVHGQGTAPAIYAWLERVPTGRLNDKNYKMKEYGTGSEKKQFNDGGSAEWKSTSKKTGY